MAVAAACLWFAPVCGARAEMAASTSPAPEKIDIGAVFDAVVETIERRFVDPQMLKRLDWRGRTNALRPSVLAAATTDDAVRQINGLISELKTSHTWLYTPDDYLYYITLDALQGAIHPTNAIHDGFWGSGPYFPGIGAFTAIVDGKHFIDGVLEGSSADKAGLKFGDEIVSIDGQPWSPVAAFRGKIGLTVRLAVRRVRDGEVKPYDVLVAPIVPSTAFAAAAKASIRIIEKNGQRIGYVHLWSINESRSLRSALTQLAGFQGKGPPLDALIVDIRGRVGGNSGSASQILDMLGSAEKPYWGRMSIIDGTGKDSGPMMERAMARMQAETSGTPLRAFKGRSALLIDHQTRSAGEVMAYGYKRSGFGTVIGTTTAGAVSGGSPVAMPHGLMLYVAGTSMAFDGQRLEGVGVVPDRQVERPLPYANGADPVLDAALEHLSNP